MPNEIYHRSDWGESKAEDFGDVYYDHAATNKLYNHSDYYENSDGTDATLKDLNNKASIVLTPTAYSDGSLNTVIPPYGLGSELLTGFTNGTTYNFTTFETDGNNITSAIVSSAFAGAVSNSMTLVSGKIYNVTFNYIKNSGDDLRVVFSSSNNGAGSQVSNNHLISESGTYTKTFTVTSSGTAYLQMGTGNANHSLNVSITNVSVKEIQEADFDFSRGSSATRVNEQGLVEDVQILSGELVQNGDFEQIGSELVTNGDFSDGSTGWTHNNLSGTSTFSVSNNELTFTRNTFGDSFYQTDVAPAVAGVYLLTFNITAISGGSLRYSFSPNSAANTSNRVSANSVGSYSTYFVSDGTLLDFVFDLDSNGASVTIDNVSVKEVGQNWTFGTGWSINDGKIYFDNPTGSEFRQSLATTAGKYRISFDLDITSGTIQTSFSSPSVSTVEAFTTSGTKTVDITTTASFSRFRFVGIGNSVFNIDNVSVKEVTDDTDLPRIDFTDGTGSLLLEPQSTNLITYSEDFSTWTKQNFPSNSETTTAPNGDTVNGYDFGDGYIFIDTANLDGTSDYTNSIYIKANKSATIGLRNGGAGGADQSQDINLTTNWVRFTATSTSTSTGAGRLLLDNRSSKGYGVSDLKVFIWGAQQEKLPYATSYIPTSGSTVTRSAEIANNSGNADLFNDSEGVLYAEIAALANDGTFRQLTISDSSTSNRVSIDFTSTDNQIRSFSSSGGSTAANMTGTVTDSKQFNKIAVKYKLNDYALWINGSEVYTDINAATPVGLQELAFDNGGGSNDFYGDVKCVAVFKEALSNDELELLTGEGYNSFAALAAAYNYNVI